MRASVASPVLLVLAGTLVLAQEGYQPEETSPYPEDAVDVVDLNEVCPTDRLLRTRETCLVDGAEVQCIRLRCCDDYNLVAGRCIPSSVDPCSLQLCEQACEVRGESVWCSCHSGYQFSEDSFREKKQPFCVDIDECQTNNGGCQQTCINDPGGSHCTCAAPLTLTADGKGCEPPVTPVTVPMTLPAPLPLIRASSRCYAPCDTVSWLSRKVRLLSDKLVATQGVLKRIMEHPMIKNDDEDKFAEGTFTYRVLDSTAPLEGGYCRCERGARGPPGAPGMEGPKGDTGARGPRGARGPKGSLDLMLLLLADLRHDIKNIEDRVYKDGEQPERFNLQKAWRRQRKQEHLDRESRSEQALEAYTVPSVEATGPVEITVEGLTGEIPHEDATTTDWSLLKETEPPDVPGSELDEQLRLLHQLATSTAQDEEEEPGDYDYSFY